MNKESRTLDKDETVWVFSATLGGYIPASSVDLPDEIKSKHMLMEPPDMYGTTRRSAQMHFYPFLKPVSIDSDKVNETYELMKKNILEFAKAVKCNNSFLSGADVTGRTLKVHSELTGKSRNPVTIIVDSHYSTLTSEVRQQNFSSSTSKEIIDLLEAEMMERESPPEVQVVSSTGRKVPKRNPKAKSWVSPYGGKRK